MADDADDKTKAPDAPAPGDENKNDDDALMAQIKEVVKGSLDEWAAAISADIDETEKADKARSGGDDAASKGSFRQRLRKGLLG